MQKFSEEIVEKAKKIKSVEELINFSKEGGMELTREQAQVYFAQLNSQSGELADDELENVAGGGCGDITDSAGTGGDEQRSGSISQYINAINNLAELSLEEVKNDL